eukprot:scaffold102462_cov16-Tisochrysis_lutea.AAC.3
MPPGGARAGQLGQVNPMNPLSRPGPMSAPTKPPQVAGKPPHVPPLRGHPSWAGQAWNPRPVGGSTLGSTGGWRSVAAVFRRSHLDFSHADLPNGPQCGRSEGSA